LPDARLYAILTKSVIKLDLKGGIMKNENTLALQESTWASKEDSQQQREPVVPLLYQKREYVIASSYLGTTTSCEVTVRPTKDYGPDD
jgi:hypothetical protein